MSGMKGENLAKESRGWRLITGNYRSRRTDWKTLPATVERIYVVLNLPPAPSQLLPTKPPRALPLFPWYKNNKARLLSRLVILSSHKRTSQTKYTAPPVSNLPPQLYWCRINVLNSDFKLERGTYFLKKGTCHPT